MDELEILLSFSLNKIFVLLVSGCPSADAMLFVNKKPDLAGSHQQSVRTGITHKERTQAVRKHQAKFFWHQAVPDANIFSHKHVDLVVSSHWTI